MLVEVEADANGFTEPRAVCAGGGGAVVASSVAWDDAGADTGNAAADLAAVWGLIGDTGAAHAADSEAKVNGAASAGVAAVVHFDQSTVVHISRKWSRDSSCAPSPRWISRAASHAQQAFLSNLPKKFAMADCLRVGNSLGDGPWGRFIGAGVIDGVGTDVRAGD